MTFLLAKDSYTLVKQQGKTVINLPFLCYGHFSLQVTKTASYQVIIQNPFYHDIELNFSQLHAYQDLLIGVYAFKTLIIDSEAVENCAIFLQHSLPLTAQFFRSLPVRALITGYQQPYFATNVAHYHLVPTALSLLGVINVMAKNRLPAPFCAHLEANLQFLLSDMPKDFEELAFLIIALKRYYALFPTTAKPFLVTIKPNIEAQFWQLLVYFDQDGAFYEQKSAQKIEPHWHLLGFLALDDITEMLYFLNEIELVTTAKNLSSRRHFFYFNYKDPIVYTFLILNGIIGCNITQLLVLLNEHSKDYYDEFITYSFFIKKALSEPSSIAKFDQMILQNGDLLKKHEGSLLLANFVQTF